MRLLELGDAPVDVGGVHHRRSSRSVRIVSAFLLPTRQGTHLPQLSWRKKPSTFVAAASRFVESSITTSAPDPSIEPAFGSASKSSGTSSASGPRKFDEAPPGCTAPSRPLPVTPPAASMSPPTVVPSGTQ